MNQPIQSSPDIAFLLSQLEEAKFTRLFRHLVNLPDGLNRPAVPLQVPEAELYLKITGEVSSLSSWAIAQLFQIGHLPAFLWDSDSIDLFVRNSLTSAFNGLRTAPSLNKALQEFNNVRKRSFPDYPIIEDHVYYFFTNTPYDLSEEALKKFTSVAHDLYSNILDEPLERHPRFGIGTPETVVKYPESDLKSFLLDLINTPSSYYFIAREGHVSVIPVTEHGAFLASNLELKDNSRASGLCTVVTSALSSENSREVSGLSELRALTDSTSTKEQDLQVFFETNPQFLLGLDDRYCDIRSHVCLIDPRGERLIPDFMARVEDSNIWDVIELKLPQHSLLTRNKQEAKPSAAAARGIMELLQYRDFFSVRQNRDKVKNRFEIAPYEPCLVLVIGRGQLGERYEWQSARIGFPRVKIVSYDYLFERAKQCSSILSKT